LIPFSSGPVSVDESGGIAIAMGFGSSRPLETDGELTKTEFAFAVPSNGKLCRLQASVDAKTFILYSVLGIIPPPSVTFLFTLSKSPGTNPSVYTPVCSELVTLPPGSIIPGGIVNASAATNCDHFVRCGDRVVLTVTLVPTPAGGVLRTLTAPDASLDPNATPDPTAAASNATDPTAAIAPGVANAIPQAVLEGQTFAFSAGLYFVKL